MEHLTGAHAAHSDVTRCDVPHSNSAYLTNDLSTCVSPTGSFGARRTRRWSSDVVAWVGRCNKAHFLSSHHATSISTKKYVDYVKRM